jgi:hypothetical protein
LTLVPKRHFKTESGAKPLAGKFVRAWEIAAGLQHSIKIHFQFEGSDIVDRSPNPGQIASQAVESLSFVDNVSVAVGITRYSAILPHFELTPEVDMLWTRYCRYLEGRELLTTMAFWCLTLLEIGSGSSKSRRQSAAKKYDIDFKVLKKIGDLTSEDKGDHLTARKASASQKPLLEKEKSWIKSAIKAIIRHLATHKTGSKLEMKDLPPL